MIGDLIEFILSIPDLFYKTNKTKSSQIPSKINTKSRITSISKTNSLDSSITGFPTFRLSQLDLTSEPNFPLPTNLRLGHLAEKVVSGLIRLSSNFKKLNENIQLIAADKTIGEIDFIIQDQSTNEVIHMELAYKFYLYDPSISSDTINNWIGPNRNDSLQEKLKKLKRKQFPLLHNPIARSKLSEINIDNTSQALCLLASLYVPLESPLQLDPIYKKYVKGYYLDFDAFSKSAKTEKMYYIPPKIEWGMIPSQNEQWFNYETIEPGIIKSMQEKKALLCWEKGYDAYSEYFIIWWK